MRAPRCTVPASRSRASSPPPSGSARSRGRAADRGRRRRARAARPCPRRRRRRRRTARTSARRTARTITTDDARPVGADDQLARRLGILGRHDARRGEQRQRLVEDAPFGERERERGHERIGSRAKPWLILPDGASLALARVPGTLTAAPCARSAARPSPLGAAIRIDVDAAATRETGVRPSALRAGSAATRRRRSARRNARGSPDGGETTRDSASRPARIDPRRRDSRAARWRSPAGR